MSLQLLMEFVQPNAGVSKSGHCAGQPIAAIESSSPLPQILSAPPHDLAMLEESFEEMTPSSMAVFASVVHTVLGGNWPFVLPLSHLSRSFARPWTYFAEPLARPRLHLSTSARASGAVPRSTIIAANAITNRRMIIANPLRRARSQMPGIDSGRMSRPTLELARLDRGGQGISGGGERWLRPRASRDCWYRSQEG